MKIYHFVFLIFFICIYSNSLSQNHQSSDHFAGIGISVDIDSSRNLPYIVDVLSGKPGAMAGLRSGDYILIINDWKTANKKSEQVAKKLRGKAGTTMELIIKRGNEQIKTKVKREVIVIENGPVNLCDPLDRLLKAAADTFSNIKGKMLNEPIEPNQPPNYEWESKLKLPKFAITTIVKKFDREAYFKAVYFLGRDSVQAVQLFDRLVSDTRDCMLYTCAESYQENNLALPSGLTNTFIISQVKAGNAANIKGSFISVIYEHQKGMPHEVRLEYRIRK